MGRGLRIGHTAGAVDLYAWYSALDLNTIPFHASSGAWGAAMAVQEAIAPTITESDFSVTSSQTITDPTPGTRFVIGASFSGGLTFNGTISDIEVVIPSAYTCGLLGIGGTRIRVRGSTIGAHSGGHFRGVIVGPSTDVILDGFKISAPGIWWGNGALDISSNSNNRVAIVNCKIRGTQAAVTSSGDHFVYAGNSIESSAYTWGQMDWGSDAPPGAAWTVRHGTSSTPVVFYQNDMRGRRFHRMRSGIAYLYMAKNQIVDLQESAILQVVGNPGSGDSDKPFAMVTDNDIHAYFGDGGGARMDADGAMYARITGNRFRTNSLDATYLSARQSAHQALRPSADVDYSTDNTFASFSRPSSWIGAGDMSDVPLEDGTVYNSTYHTDDQVGIAP